MLFLQNSGTNVNSVILAQANDKNSVFVQELL